MGEPGEEDSPHLDHQITQWRLLASLTTLWEHLEAILQRLAQEALVC